MKRLGRYTLELEHRPRIACWGSVCGKKERQGPLGDCFDASFEDTTLGEKTWEKAESRLQAEAVRIALEKGGLAEQAVDCVFAGDLLNQCISSTFGLRSLGIPFLGQYGACSTMGQSLAMAAVFVEGGAANRALAVTSSHFCSAERQFRFPLEYGGQRPLTSQWTVTAAGAAVVAGNTAAGAAQPSSGSTAVARVTVGRIADLGIKDANNMGAAMAPAAAQTLADFFEDTATGPESYDLILTGDLGQVGSQLLYRLLEDHGINIRDKHEDCGLLIYDREKQDVHAGGSGCGCAASVVCAKLFPEMEKGLYQNVLFLPTGALMSTTSSQQGESIPSIAHLLQFTAG